jgi:hypothetical protein
MPERRADHVLDGQLFSVCEFDLCLSLLLAHTRDLPAYIASYWWTIARILAARGAWLLRLLYALAGVTPGFLPEDIVDILEGLFEHGYLWTSPARIASLSRLYRSICR